LSTLSDQGTLSTGIPNDASSSTSIADSETQSRQLDHGPSDYEKRRQANIAENRRLLASLGLEGGSSALLKEKGYAFCLFYLSNCYYLTFLQITSG
jgi:hypothetical protein